MKAPEFTLPDDNGNLHKLSDYYGSWVLVYFYPKDDTPGCTKEACNFSNSYSEFKKYGVEVIGISTDSVESHSKFKSKYGLKFPLLSDNNKDAITAYKAWGKKKFLGKTFEGTLRKSYLIDPTGEIQIEYKDVNPMTHSVDVLADIKRLQKILH